ncbi:MAG: glutamate racemase [Clostridia bacterium]|nr:glutamate racemase [Clostridia bacterium]
MMKPIGIFDSGLGGLCALKELRALMPGTDLIYFGDTGRTPYGTRSAETIMKYANQDARFLMSQNVCAVLIACGTVSTVALNALKLTLPVPVYGVVSAASVEAAKATKNGKIGVTGTGATIGSGVFEHELKLINGDFEVHSVACPLLVPIVEYGFSDDEIAYLAVKKYIDPLKEKGVDTVILGCTHFPILKKVMEKAAPGVTFIDSGAAAARKIASEFRDGDGEGTVHCYVSDTPSNFNKTAGVFLGKNFDFDVKRIDIEAY